MTRRKLWAFRTLALLLPLAALGALEVVFRVAGWGQPDPLRDPFLQHAATPLFERSQETGDLRTRQEKLRVFPPQQFASQKSPNELRIFCLGGSTVQGRPYSSPTAFPEWLRLNLQLAHPDRHWSVVNCGGISYGTQRLIPVLEECLRHQPDMIILCTGHNEFLERQIYDRLPSPARTVARAVRGLHLYRAIESLTTPRETATVGLPPEVDTILDHPGGLESYRWDPTWRDHVIATFEDNLSRMIRACADGNVPVLLVAPPSNLKDCPPIKAGFTRTLTASEESRWDALLEASRFREALELDPQHPLTHYLIGQSQFARLDFSNALEHLTLARDNDICPLRMISAQELSLAALARKTGTPLLDAQQLLAGHCTAAIPGNQILLDHVHPSVRGHQLIAEYLLPLVKSTLGLRSSEITAPDRQAAYQSQIDALPPLYFTHGLRRLRAVQAWTEGRVDPPRDQ